MVSVSELFFYVTHLCALLSFVAYAVASTLLILDVLLGYSTVRSLTYRCLSAGLLAHTAFLFAQGLELLTIVPGEKHFLLPSSALSVSVIACLLAAGFLFLRGRVAVHGLGLFVLPIVLLLSVFSAYWFHFQSSMVAYEPNSLLLVHILFTIVGHVAFVAAFAVSIAVIVQEGFLKRRSFSLVLRAFPPLRVLDSLNAMLIAAGTLAMGLGVVLGAVFAMQTEQLEVLFSARAFWSLITLLLYSSLMAAIWFWGYRGRRAAWFSVLGYGSILCSFLGVHWWGAVFHVH